MAEDGTSVPRGIRWELESHDDDTGWWSWRHIGADGAIARTSEPHSSFGRAIRDAMANGFSPSSEHWVIKSNGWVTHFTPGSAPLTISPDDRLVQRTNAAPGGSSPPSEIEKKAP